MVAHVNLLFAMLCANQQGRASHYLANYRKTRGVRIA